jgi:23S rRNA (cytidine2498-2'-O)-methyltransferase
MIPQDLLLYCRPGFEKECLAEVQHQAAELGLGGYARLEENSGWVLFKTHEPQAELLQIQWQDLVFSRQRLWVLTQLDELPDNRIAPIIEALVASGMHFADFFCETADTNAAKELSVFCRKFTVPLRQALKKAALLRDNSAWRLHLFFQGSHQVILACCKMANSSPYPMGIVRLRFPAQAPSRSTLKLEEGLLTLLSAEERELELKAQMRAVDLGASPGGWTWQMTERGISVIAIDNGPMDKTLMQSGFVEHLRVDGFHYCPPRQQDWVLCDMVEQPARIAELMANWVAKGWARQALFNLKLPMKKRFDELQRCRQLIERRFEQVGLEAELRIRQLYHDREEVTCYLVPHFDSDPS